jgi:hypothetical protein
MVDMAHFAGLVAARRTPPVPHAHVVTTTTHKTLRGPRGGMILPNEGSPRSQLGVFPGLQGGPLMHVIAGKAVAFHEAAQPEFRSYQQQVLANAQELAEVMRSEGYPLVSAGPTTTCCVSRCHGQGRTGRSPSSTSTGRHHDQQEHDPVRPAAAARPSGMPAGFAGWSRLAASRSPKCGASAGGSRRCWRPPDDEKVLGPRQGGGEGPLRAVPPRRRRANTGEGGAMTAAEWQAATQERIDDAAAALARADGRGRIILRGYIVEYRLEASIVARLGREPEAIFGDDASATGVESRLRHARPAG